MSERDVIELLAETRDWLRDVQIGDAVPAIDTGIAEIIRLRAEVERLRLTDAEREALDNAAQWLVAIQSADDPRAGECAATLRNLLARHGGER